jgi:acyl-CoA reductase-like NAD-dependent aldehyde dehydrogenase
LLSTKTSIDTPHWQQGAPLRQKDCAPVLCEINCYQAIDPTRPFSGYKISGYGGESGIQQMEAYLNGKAVWITIA